MGLLTQCSTLLLQVCLGPAVTQGEPQEGFAIEVYQGINLIDIQLFFLFTWKTEENLIPYIMCTLYTNSNFEVILIKTNINV